MGLPPSHGISRAPWYSLADSFVTLSRPGFLAGSSMSALARLCHKTFLLRFWALTLSLATTQVIVVLLSLPPGT